MIVAAIYLLFMLGKVVWGMLVEPHTNHDEPAAEAHGPALPRDLSWREIGTLLPLAVACLALGVYPRPLLKALEAPTQLAATTVREGYNRIAAPGAPPRARASLGREEGGR
jgi:NADH:ubiquinone oxidoreductase subunit 4 (subunit M)